MCGICGIHVNSCGKNHGTGIKSNMLQECRGVSDVAQNYTTQTGFRAVSSKKIFRSVHPALVYSTKVFETKTKENRNNKERIRRFQSRVQHIWWFLCTSTIMQNTLELVKQICPRLLVSPSFPDLVIHARATPTGIGLQLLRELSRSVCQILPGAPHHDLWELRWIGYLQYWKCAMPVCSRGALQQLTVLAQKRENHGNTLSTFAVSPKFPARFPVFFQMFKVSHVFHHLFPSFSPFLSSMFSHFSPMKFTISGAKPWWNFPSSEMVSRLRFRLHDKISWMLRAPKGSERPEICDVAHSESLDMIGHLRCEWIRFRLFDMNRHSESIWHHWNIFNI